MENKENMTGTAAEQNSQASAEQATENLASYYAAAASAAETGHVFQSVNPSPPAAQDQDHEKSLIASDDRQQAEIQEGMDADATGISADGSPHGPLPELNEDPAEDAADEPNSSSPAPMEAAYDPTLPPPDDDEEDEEADGAEDDGSMGILGHLGELRRRLMRIFIAIFLGWIALYGVSELIFGYLSAPLQACMPEGSKLIYTSPQGAFFTYLKVAFITSLFATSPFTFYQTWAFVAPGLYREEKRALLPLAFCSSFFFVGGAAFCFFLVFPIAFKFFMGFATDTIVPMISVEEYLSFALKLLVAFGLVFEMPLFSFFLSRFGILSPAFMRRTRRYAILIIFITAAILTPPDVISQILMALPMIVLYELSIYVSATAYRERNAEKKQEEAQP